MRDGISTHIPSPAQFSARWAMAERDARSLIEHGPVMVTVAQFVPRGTLDQGRLFHALCAHIAEWWCGRHPENPTTPEQVKRDLKVKFGVISTAYSPVSDQRTARLASWAEYSKAQRSDLITATLAWMADSGCPDLPTLPPAEYERYREAKRA